MITAGLHDIPIHKFPPPTRVFHLKILKSQFNIFTLIKVVVQMLLLQICGPNFAVRFNMVNF